MASTPNFGSTPRLGTAILTDADGSSSPKDVGNFTPPAAGTRVNTITVNSGPSVAPGGSYVIVIFVHDGTSSVIRDQFTLNNAVNTRQATFYYKDFKIPSGSKLQVQSRTTLASGASLHFTVDGEDLT
jgi:hypothetical protein